MLDETGAKQRVFVVMNPMAGSCTADEVRQALEKNVSSSGNVEIYETTGASDENVAAIARKAARDGFPIVAAAGGDGTVSEVAEGLIGTDVPMGIIPVGTANVFARELGLPLAMEEACALLAGPHSTTNVDAMKVGDDYYILQIGIGIDAFMIRDTERTAKRRFGRAAYLWTAATRLVGFQPVRFTIVVDGQRHRPRASQVLIANGGVLGIPPFRWGPNICPDDGRIDVCVVSARTALDYLGLFWHAILGQQRRDRNLRYYSAHNSIVISADKPMPIQADGEIIGETPLQLKVVPSAVQVITPAPAVASTDDAAEARLVGT